jgi:hypothetical protein
MFTSELVRNQKLHQLLQLFQIQHVRENHGETGQAQNAVRFTMLTQISGV